MAYFGVRGGDVVVEVAVFRGLVDLMLDDPGLDDGAVKLLTEEREVGALSFDLVKPSLREQLEAALAGACDAAAAGKRSPRSGDEVADPERLMEGAEAVRAHLGG
ncbi:MAG TPA: hypothetical protein VEN99_13225 [Acidimicrobiia bacterium]|nr:hypothetical protein [Acidimicrobiia bacterium]